MRLAIAFCVVVVVASFSSCNREEEIVELRSAKERDSLNKIPGWDSIFAAHAACLPYPDQRFLDGSLQDSQGLKTGRADYGDFSMDNFYLYLVLHLDSLNAKQLIAEDDFWGPVEWTQSFENGVEYYHIDYVEVGTGGELHTRCKDKSTFIAVLSPMFSDRSFDEQTRNRWNRDSTYYGPGDLTAGCHYDVKHDENGFFYLHWTCAC